VARSDEWRLGENETQLRLLGGFNFRLNGNDVNLPPAGQRLVALLALRDRPLVRAFVLGMLWPEAPEERGFACLRSLLWRVNCHDNPLILASRQHLTLASHIHVDVRDVHEAVHRLIRGGCHSPPDLDLLLITGDLLPDWYDEWLVVERESLRQLRVHALEMVCEQLTTERRYGEALEAALAALALDPLRESAHRALIRLHLSEHNYADAVAQYSLCRRLLLERLDVAPSAELQELIRPAAAAPAVPVPAKRGRT
jgi:DNA-binding SARP family transcriptional activator